MRIIKRNGSEEKFNVEKIISAITRADESQKEPAMNPDEIKEMAQDIHKECKKLKRAVSVEEIQDMVERKLMESGHYELAKDYITYRYERFLARKSNTIDQQILTLIERNNEEIKQENSNKNPTINSVQRDYMAGEVSKDITKRFLLPPDVVEAHEQGIIHFHDADYFAQHMHNCFHSKTKFITSDGIKEFRECSDGQNVRVLASDGVFRGAVVKKYGKKQMQRVVFGSGNRKKEVICTPDHRWILSDGSVTTNLKEGDRLIALEDSTYISVDSDRECSMFALGALIADGCDHNNSNHHEIRLCGDKVKWADVMKRAGYRIANIDNSTDLMCTKRGYMKQDFLNGKGWKYLSETDKKALFYGLKTMDGSGHRLTTADERVAELIRDISAVAGWHISSETTSTRATNYKDDRILHCFHLICNQSANQKWKVLNITPERPETEYDAWCVEEPVTHSFTLEGGMVTGNCDLVNLEDMLQNGTVISGTLIEKPHSFSTACNIATQIIAQVASSQYGGQSISLTHLAPFVQVSREKITNDVLVEFAEAGCEVNEEKINKIIEKRVREEVARGVQTIQYQVVTLMTTNG